MLLPHCMTAQPRSNASNRTLADILERHEREYAAFLVLTEPEQARFQVAQRLRYAQDSWAFLSDCVITLDQVDQVKPIKPFPSYLEYLHFLCKLWQREKLLAIPKSRRMVCSWGFISLFSWDTFFHEGRFNAFVSKKEDDSGELVSRAEFIYNKIPRWRIPRALLPKLENSKMSKQPPLLNFPEIQSKIQGFPQGSDQMRQFTFSGMLFDEWAFWEQAQAAYSAAKPTLDGGGRLVGISSRSPGFFKRVVFDQFDAPDLTFREVPPVPPLRPLEGVEMWKNPKNKFCVVDLHYTANPEKRGTAWREAIRSSMPRRDFEMEYEKSWQTFEGKPVYADFNRALHISPSLLKPEPGIPLLLGWDFGLTPACILAQLVGRQLRILQEFIETNGSISKLAPVVQMHLQTNYLPWMRDNEQLTHYVDPAGFQRAQTDERTCIDVMRTVFGPQAQIFPGPVNWESRRKAVEDYLTKTYGEGPGLLISDTCPVLIEGFNGGYMYPEKAIEIEPANITPIKNKFSHCFPAGTKIATPYGQTAIEDIRVGTLVLAPGGNFRVTATMNRPDVELVEVIFSSGRTLRCTPDHPIWNGTCFVRADALQYGYTWEDQRSIQSKCSTASNFIANQVVTIKPIIQSVAFTCIAMSGKWLTDLFHMAWKYIIRTETGPTTAAETSNALTNVNMPVCTAPNALNLIRKLHWLKYSWRRNSPVNGIVLRQVVNGIANTLNAWLHHFQLMCTPALSAEGLIQLNAAGVNVVFADPIASHVLGAKLESITNNESVRYAQNLSALTNTLNKDHVVSIVRVPAEHVYDLTIETAHCFYANGVLVSNCHDALQYLCAGATALRKAYKIDLPIPNYGFASA